ADPPGRGPALGRLTDAEELTQQQILGVHGDVGRQLALPPAGRVLQAEQMPAPPHARAPPRRQLSGLGARGGGPIRDCRHLQVLLVPAPTTPAAAETWSPR